MKFYPRHIVNLRGEIFKVLAARILTGQLVEGPDILKFEHEFSKYVGTKFAVGISQARFGLIAIFKALNFNEGDEIIISSYNYHIVIDIIMEMELKPVFVDIEASSRNINPALIKEKITNRTKAILITHMFGQPVDMDSVGKIAKEHRIKVIEDCAHALGSEYNGKKVGSIGDVAIFSFGMGKNMPCFGGGMITTNDNCLFESIRELVDLARFPSLKTIFTNIAKHSINSLLTCTPLFTFLTFPLTRILDLFDIDIMGFWKKETLQPVSYANSEKLPLKLINAQAATGLKQLEKIEYFNDRRIKNSLSLTKNLEKFDFIKLPIIVSGCKNIYLYYIVRVENKYYFRKQLLKRGIDTSKESGMTNCSVFSGFDKYSTNCPIAASIENELFEIPNNCFLSSNDIDYISESIKEIAVLKL